jgi:hypothetical protein
MRDLQGEDRWMQKAREKRAKKKRVRSTGSGL